MSDDGSAVGLKQASRITDDWLRPLAALIAPFALWVSMLHCQRSWGYCSEFGCATGTTIGPGCTKVAGVGLELWALGVVIVATAVCVFGGIHRL